MNARLCIIITLALVVSAYSTALTYPVGGIPTALMAPDRTVTLNYYSVDTKPKNKFFPNRLDIENAFIGINARLELDINNFKLERVPAKTTIDLQYLISPEGHSKPAIALGIQDITEQIDDSSVYLAMVKVVSPTSRKGPIYPVVRLHLSYGTEPREAFFGGVQVRWSPEFATVTLSDGHDGILGAGYFVPKTTLILKAGTFGNKPFWGAEYRLPFD